jgi:hypothetical protein
MIANAYWVVAQNDSRFDVGTFVLKDLDRPLFEPYEFCGAWVQYSSGLSALLGIDFPAYLAATLLHSAITWRASCVDALITPRGHIISAAFVFALWLLVGLSLRRFAERRWHRPVKGRTTRAVVALGLTLLPVGLLSLLFSVVGLFASDIGTSLSLAGIAFWCLYASALAAERLRIWPFANLDSPS